MVRDSGPRGSSGETPSKGDLTQCGRRGGQQEGLGLLEAAAAARRRFITTRPTTKWGRAPGASASAVKSERH